jgi:hypothetical protein
MDDLVQRLLGDNHNVRAEYAKTPAELKQSIDRGVVLIRFPDTRGGTTLSVTLDSERSRLADADFGGGSGSVTLIGKLVLNYHEVELEARIDLSTLEGKGGLKVLADEEAWRAQKEAASDLHTMH